MKKWFCWLSILLLLSCVFVSAACGKTEKPPETPPPATEDDPPEESDPPEDLPPAKETWTVTLVYNNGERDGSIAVEKGEPAAEPEEPKFGPHTFLGWYRAGERYDWSTPVTEDITVQALWEKQYRVALETRNGGWTQTEGEWRSSVYNSFLADDTGGFDRGTIEVTVHSEERSDNGIVLCLTGNGTSRYWEEGVSYYFFFLNIDGNAYLGKVDHGVWTALKVLPVLGYQTGKSYRLKTVLDGTDIYCYVDGKLYIAFSERNFLKGTGYGFRTDTADVLFSGIEVSGKCKYESD